MRISVLLVTITVLFALAGCGDSKETTKPVYTASSQGDEHHGVARAFDGSTAPDDFWEAGGFPQWVQVSYGKETAIKTYELSTGELPQRMPKSWVFQGSKDGSQWTTLDEQGDQKPWSVGEKRAFSLSDTARFPQYRILFTAGNDPGIIRVYEISIR